MGTNYKWSKEKIVAMIKEFNENHNNLQPYFVQKTNKNLYMASRTYFGSWKSAVEASGIAYKTKRRPSGYWDDPKNVITEIKNLYDQSENLSSNNVSKKFSSKLVSSAKKYYGSWNNAIIEVEKEYGIEINKKTHRENGFFSNNENILNEIKKRASNGLSLQGSDMKNDDSSLYHYGRKIFGSWEKAVSLAGYELDKKENIWSKEKVSDQLKRIKENGSSLKFVDLIKENKKLASACISYFGTYRKALEAIGVDHDEILDRWSKEKIKSEIQGMINANQPINSAYIQKHRNDIFKACYRIYGDYEKAMEDIGLNYEDVKLLNYWTKEKVIDGLRDRISSNLPMSATDLINDDYKLYSSACRYFGNYKSAVEYCGLDYDDITRQNNWNKDKVINAINELYNSGEPLNMTHLMQSSYGTSILNACKTHFESYENALKECGINYDNIREDRASFQYYGRKFEVFLGRLLNELEINYTKGYTKLIRPDFVLSKGVWLDAKLSEWTVYRSETIEKYQNHCRFLIIVFLRSSDDENFKDYMINKQTRCLSVFNLIKQLPKNKRKKFENEAKLLIINSNENKNTLFKENVDG